MMDENRPCKYFKYGGCVIEGLFHRWIDVKEVNSDGEYTRALVEDKETGHMDVINIKSIWFVNDEK